MPAAEGCIVVALAAPLTPAAALIIGAAGIAVAPAVAVLIGVCACDAGVEGRVIAIAIVIAADGLDAVATLGAAVAISGFALADEDAAAVCDSCESVPGCDAPPHAQHRTATQVTQVPRNTRVAMSLEWLSFMIPQR